MVSGLEIAATVILAVGIVGYAVSLLILWRFWAWMGTRGAGWPRLLLRTLIVLMALLGALYSLSLAITLDLVPNRAARIWLNFGVGIALAAAPWTVVLGMWQWWGMRWRDALWWRRATAGERDGIP
jgi:hypothetical protein